MSIEILTIDSMCLGNREAEANTYCLGIPLAVSHQPPMVCKVPSRFNVTDGYEGLGALKVIRSHSFLGYDSPPASKSPSLSESLLCVKVMLPTGQQPEGARERRRSFTPISSEDARGAWGAMIARQRDIITRRAESGTSGSSEAGPSTEAGNTPGVEISSLITQARFLMREQGVFDDSAPRTRAIRRSFSGVTLPIHGVSNAPSNRRRERASARVSRQRSNSLPPILVVLEEGNAEGLDIRENASTSNEGFTPTPDTSESRVGMGVTSSANAASVPGRRSVRFAENLIFGPTGPGQIYRQDPERGGRETPVPTSVGESSGRGESSASNPPHPPLVGAPLLTEPSNPNEVEAIPQPPPIPMRVSRLNPSDPNDQEGVSLSSVRAPLTDSSNPGDAEDIPHPPSPDSESGLPLATRIAYAPAHSRRQCWASSSLYRGRCCGATSADYSLPNRRPPSISLDPRCCPTLSNAVAGPSSLQASTPVPQNPLPIALKQQRIAAVEEIVPTLQTFVAAINQDCRLDVKTISLHGPNTEYNPKRSAAVIMRIREPKTTALIFASGKMVVTGAQSDDDSRLASRNCGVKFLVRLEGLAYSHRQFSSYEPEIFPGLIYRMNEPKVVLLVFMSGKTVLTGCQGQYSTFPLSFADMAPPCTFRHMGLAAIAVDPGVRRHALYIWLELSVESIR
ncbi:hypothetical protein NMY22_g11607 [Coprinellus aureogranulatus]|nr:hypothetical protein NMY22_g11607 [Coprinellus aureogranulatus]